VQAPLGTCDAVTDEVTKRFAPGHNGRFATRSEPGATRPSGSTASGRQTVIPRSGRSPAPRPDYFTGAIRC
jgi:hypothetical protein